MNPKTLLRFFILLIATVGGLLFLIAAGKASAEKIRLNEESSQSIAEETSNTEFIFFGSINRFFAASLSK